MIDMIQQMCHDRLLLGRSDVILDPISQVEGVIGVFEDERMLQESSRVRAICLLLLKAVGDELNEFRGELIAGELWGGFVDDFHQEREKGGFGRIAAPVGEMSERGL